jgi:hypothetical protein
MTVQETVEILKILQTAYPNFGRNADDLKRTIGLWASMFSAESLEIVAAATKALIASDTKGFPPTIGAVKEQITKLTIGRQLTENEAWNTVSRALKNSTYNSEEEFSRLPPTVQRVVGGPSQLRTWARMDSNEVESVVSSNFQRSFRAAAQEEKTLRAMPPDVRAVFASCGQALSLEAETPAKDTPALSGACPQQKVQQETARENSEQICERLRQIKANLMGQGKDERATI